MLAHATTERERHKYIPSVDLYHNISIAQLSQINAHLIRAQKTAMSTRRIRNRDKQALSSCCQLTKIASCTENPQHCLSQVTEQKDGFGDDPILKRRTYVLHMSRLRSLYPKSYAELLLRAASQSTWACQLSRAAIAILVRFRLP